jgi:histidinol-phosphate aminotransferase
MINLKLGDIKESLPQKILDRFCKEVFKNVNLYPQNYNLLISKLAEKFNVEPENIVLTNGVDEGIDLITKIFGKKILFFPPSYFEFAEAPRRNNLNFEVINSFDGEKYKIVIDGDKLKNRTLIFLCNPNNPFGILSKSEAIEIAKKTNGLVAIDETYVDFFGESTINEFKTTPNILVLRSFSKGFSLAGLRIGFIVGEKSLIDKIRQRKIFFTVTSVSVNAAIICLEEEKYFKNLIKEIIQRKKLFEEFLRKKGFNIIESFTNNIIIKFPDIKEADQFFNFLKENQVIVNQGDGISTYGLDNTFIRFSCGTEEQMKELREIIDGYR